MIIISINSQLFFKKKIVYCKFTVICIYLIEQLFIFFLGNFFLKFNELSLKSIMYNGLLFFYIEALN